VHQASTTKERAHTIARKVSTLKCVIPELLQLTISWTKIWPIVLFQKEKNKTASSCTSMDFVCVACKQHVWWRENVWMKYTGGHCASEQGQWHHPSGNAVCK